MGRRLLAFVALASATVRCIPSLAGPAPARTREFEMPIRLTPLFIENVRLPSGARRTAALGLFHWTRYDSGETHSYHVVNYFKGPNYKVFFPLAYGVGPPGEKHQGVIPFYFQGPGYKTIPPLLYGRWENYDQSVSTWITPLFHMTRNIDGSVRNMHALNYYLTGGPGERHHGVVPFYFQGPEYKVIPPFLSGRWTNYDRSVSTWITPLFHVTREADGSLRNMHALIYFESGGPGGRHHSVPPLYFQGPGYRIIPPLLYGTWENWDRSRSTWITPLFHMTREQDGTVRNMHALNYFMAGSPGSRHHGVVPVYFQGPDYKVIPPLLSGRWEHLDRSVSTWITPLFHMTRESDGSLRRMHALNYLQGRDYKVLFPLAYSTGPPGAGHRGFIPLYFQGRDYRFLPPLLSGWWRWSDGSTSLWGTPLFHVTREQDGTVRNMHALNYYMVGSPGLRHRGVVPFYFQGPDYKVIPPLLSGTWGNYDGSTSSWATPFFHVTREKDGSLRNRHALNYYMVGSPGSRHHGLVPFYFQGPDYKLIPPFLSGRWTKPGGAAATWITPLFHVTREQDGTVRNMHAVNYYMVGRPGERRHGVVPFYFQGPDYKLVPPLLSGKWKNLDGSASTWITPLFHITRESDGSLRRMHALNYFQGRDYKVLFPFAYSGGPREEGHRGFVPFFFRGPDYWAVPALLTGRWGNPDGSHSLWVTPFFHRAREADGSLRRMHAFNYFQGPNYKVFFPLGYSVGPPGRRHGGVIPFAFWGPGYFQVPATWPLALFYFQSPNGKLKLSIATLSAWWKRSDDSQSLWITPLFHKTREADGTISRMHALTYFQGPDYKVCFPLGYSVGPPGLKHQGVIPFYFRGPGYKLVPPLLSGQWEKADGSQETWMTPFFHATRDVDGTFRSMHLFPFYFRGQDYELMPPLLCGKWTRFDGSVSTWVTPLFHVTRALDGTVQDMHALNYFMKGRPGMRHHGVVPFYFQGPGYRTIPPLLSGTWENWDRSRSTWVTPLFHRTREEDGSVRNMHALNYFMTGSPGERHYGFVPIYFQGPDYKIIPPLLSGTWENPGGSRSTWITPLFHETRERYGTLRDMHVFPFYFRGPHYEVVFPIMWHFERPLEGASLTVVPPFVYRRGRKLNKSVGFRLLPFSRQRAGEDVESKFLWSLPYVRREKGRTRVVVFPLWWSDRPAPGSPAEFQVLGGLVARDCNYETGRYRYRILWGIPVTRGRAFGRRRARSSPGPRTAPFETVPAGGQASTKERAARRRRRRVRTSIAPAQAARPDLDVGLAGLRRAEAAPAAQAGGGR